MKFVLSGFIVRVSRLYVLIYYARARESVDIILYYIMFNSVFSTIKCCILCLVHISVR